MAQFGSIWVSDLLLDEPISDAKSDMGPGRFRVSDLGLVLSDLVKTLNFLIVEMVDTYNLSLFLCVCVWLTASYSIAANLYVCV